jgi:hypothetical protein
MNSLKTRRLDIKTWEMGFQFYDLEVKRIPPTKGSGTEDGPQLVEPIIGK